MNTPWRRADNPSKGAATISHRIIIARAIAGAFADPVVREEMNENQCTKVQNLLATEEPTPEAFRELTHCLNRVYSKDD